MAVLLAIVTAYYASTVAMVRNENEELMFSNEHIWVNSGAIAAFRLQNVGGKDVLLDKFSVRGVEQSWSSVWYYRVPSGTGVTVDMNITQHSSLSGSPVLIDGRKYTMATDDIPLQSEKELLVYIQDPGNIQVDDIGTTVSIAAFSNNAQYVTELIVESATTK